MKALVLYGPENFKVEEYPEPEVKPGWVKVKVAYVGLCGSDLPRFFTTGSYHAPMVIGHEFSGVVSERGEGCEIAVGTPVAVLPIIPCGECEGCKKTGEPFHCLQYQFIGSRNDGGLAEYCLVPEKNCFPLESAALLRRGAFVEPILVGLHAVRRSGAKSGKAIVFGAGPIGLMIALWLNYFKIATTIVDVRDYSLQMARSMGFSNVMHFTDLGTETFDYLFEASGAPPVFTKALELADHKAVFTVVGRSPSDTVIPTQLLEQMMRKEVTVKGCWGYNLAGDDAVLSDAFATIDFEKLISHVVTLDESVAMLHEMNKKSIDYCKVLIDMRSKT